MPADRRAHERTPDTLPTRALRRVHGGLVHAANRTPAAVAAYLATVLAAAWAIALFEGWSFGDAVWWAFTTTTTTGYGDFSPVTGGGRVVAVLTMFAGIVAIGVIVGRIAAVVIRTHDDFTHEEQVELLDDSDEQTRLLHELHARLDVLDAAAGRPARHTGSSSRVPGAGGHGSPAQHDGAPRTG
ncbi:potassium channel family protein [Goekera deserti]|nr:potassium channel family protein [Goekera deserti]